MAYIYGLCSHGLYSHGLYSYGLYSYGLYCYGLCSYGMQRRSAEASRVSEAKREHEALLGWLAANEAVRLWLWPYIVMAPYSYGPYSYGLHSCGLHSYGLHGYISWSFEEEYTVCLLYTSPSPRDRQKYRIQSSA